jgi:hypothetical protein
MMTRDRSRVEGALSLYGAAAQAKAGLVPGGPGPARGSTRRLRAHVNKTDANAAKDPRA